MTSDQEPRRPSWPGARPLIPPAPPAGPSTVGDRVYFGGKVNPSLPWKPMLYMEDYLHELEGGEKPHSPDYTRMVKVALAHFSIFMSTENVMHPDEIRRDHLIRFQGYLLSLRTAQRQTPLKVAYRQRLMAYIGSWINWLEDVGYITSTPWIHIRIGRTMKQPKPLEVSEIEDLFAAHRNQAFNIPPFAFHRREVILVLLFGWGLRVSELQSLNVAQMFMNVTEVTVRGKGGGTRPMPYGLELKQVVQRWLPKRAEHAIAGEDALLIDQSGGRLSIARIREIVISCGERAGMTINPHRLRDSFGTTLLDNDVPLERIMKLMGHTKQAQTLAYTRVNNSKVIESHEAVMGPMLSRLTGFTKQDVPQQALTEDLLQKFVALTQTMYPDSSDMVDWVEVLAKIETEFDLELPDNMNDPVICKIQSTIRRARRAASAKRKGRS